MNIFKEPSKTQWNVLSLGAGVQSSCLALMAAKGEIKPTPDFAVFADTGAEPDEVYEWLKTLKGLIEVSENPFPVFIVKHGDLEEESLKPIISKGKGKRPAGDTYIKKLIPMFGILPNGEKTAAIGRVCTADYKIKPIHKFIKEKCDVKRGQKEITITQWIGISWDEIQRAKDSRVSFMQNRFPLLENKMNRVACFAWMAKNNFPKPPRSACYFCPFHSDEEWRRLRNEDPKYFAKAIVYDKKLREAFINHNKVMKMKMYLHSSCIPLGEINFDNDIDKGQQVWDFQAECEGMCGV